MNIFDEMIEEALKICEQKNINIYTFCFYHDHESKAFSICIDTEEKSKITILQSNEFTKKYFHEELKTGNLEGLKNWCFQHGRSFSLGDFRYCNIVYKKIGTNSEIVKENYIEMINSIEKYKEKIKNYSINPDNIFFACSSENNEVEYIWQ